MTQKQIVTVYTDGACKGNPGLGGWGAFLSYGEHQKSIYGGAKDTTNNRMELMAVIESLKLLKRSCTVEIYTDSKYVQQGMLSWLENWKAKGWKNSKKEPVKNQDLWQILDEQVARHEVTWHWVKGHAGNYGNEKADELANLGVEEARNA